MSTPAKQRIAKLRKRHKDLPKSITFEAAGSVDLAAAGEGDDAKGPRKFDMVAYNGGKMRPQGFPDPVVVEVSKIEIAAGTRPVHFNHDTSRPVGHGEITKAGSQILAEGALSIDNEDSRMIASSGDNGFPWKASIGAHIGKLKFYDKGRTFEANGKTFHGPAFHMTAGTIHEVSFVTVAGDNSSSARIAASADLHEDHDMFNTWLQAKGFDPDNLSDDQEKFLRAMFDQEQAGSKDDSEADDKKKIEASGGQTPEEIAASAVEASRKAAAEELGRQSELQSICAQYGNPKTKVGEQEVNLLSHAVAEGWSAEKTELHALRASRSSAPAIHSGDSRSDLTATKIECALRLSLQHKEEDLAKDYGEKTLEAAKEYRDIGMCETAQLCCHLEGVSIPRVWGNGKESLRAAFTTQSLPAIFENVLNKSLLNIFEATASVAMELCRVARVNDFKEVSRVRLLGAGAWEKVGADGELKHGMISDEKFTNQAETYGQYLVLTRQDWRNDDLGALDDISRYMAIMGRQVVEDEFFLLLLSNPNNFFSSGNGNLGTTPFGDTGLSALKTLFRKIKAGPGNRKKDKRSINVMPTKLVVPVELEDEAASLLGSSNLMMENRDTSSTTPSKTAPANPHFARYELFAPPQISDDAFPGSSDSDYYLFSDTGMVAAFELAFLDGITNPTIERVEAPSHQLGMGFRGYIDFGVREQDVRGAAKSDVP